jgi:hypothetical protein
VPMLYISEVVEKAHGRELDEIAPNWTRFVASPDAGEPDYDAIDFFYFSGDIYPDRVKEAGRVLDDLLGSTCCTHCSDRHALFARLNPRFARVASGSIQASLESEVDRGASRLEISSPWHGPNRV